MLPLPTTATATPASPLLRLYQQEGVHALLDILKNRRAAALFDEPGLGKTAQALAVAEARGAKRVLVIGPAIARGAWAIETHKFAPDRLGDFHVVAPDAAPGEFRLDAPNLVLVFGYDTFSRASSSRRWVRALTSRRWDLLVLDEAHYLKTDDSARTRSIYGELGRGRPAGLQAACERVLLLTGTPTPNHAGELYPHIAAFWPELVAPRTLEQFQERYTRYEDTIFGRQVRGSQLQRELRDKLAPVVVQRRRRDVLAELPPLQIEDAPLAHVSVFPVIEPVPDLEDAESLSRMRRELGLAKVGAAAAWIIERLNYMGVDKMLVFAWHRDVIEALQTYLFAFKPAVITGATPSHVRAAEVHRFQNDPSCLVLVGQMLAAGSAITLTAAHHVAIVEPSWVPGENEQAIARAWRMGQRHPVLASFLYLPGTLDEVVMRTFRRKAAEVLQLKTLNIDDHNGALQNAN